VTAPFKAACVQLNNGRDFEPNIQTAVEYIRAASASGAELIATPEVTDLLEPKGRLLRDKIKPEEAHPGLEAFVDLAAELSCWLLIGSLLIKRDEERAANRSFLIDPHGKIAARYDKIHMFDVEIADGQSYRESRRFRPGEESVTAELPWGTLGLTICYDVRFPYLYRALAKAGARILTVPSAFTRVTGEAHWHSLLRARAIETGCYVMAPAQCGVHAEGRETFGHSLIVDPWGRVLADGGTEPGFVTAVIDPENSARAQSMIPSLAGDRSFEAPALLD